MKDLWYFVWVHLYVCRLLVWANESTKTVRETERRGLLTYHVTDWRFRWSQIDWMNNIEFRLVNTVHPKHIHFSPFSASLCRRTYEYFNRNERWRHFRFGIIWCWYWRCLCRPASEYIIDSLVANRELIKNIFWPMAVCPLFPFRSVSSPASCRPYHWWAYQLRCTHSARYFYWSIYRTFMGRPYRPTCICRFFSRCKQPARMR